MILVPLRLRIESGGPCPERRLPSPDSQTQAGTPPPLSSFSSSLCGDDLKKGTDRSAPFLPPFLSSILTSTCAGKSKLSSKFYADARKKSLNPWKSPWRKKSWNNDKNRNQKCLPACFFFFKLNDGVKEASLGWELPSRDDGERILFHRW